VLHVVVLVSYRTPPWVGCPNGSFHVARDPDDDDAHVSITLPRQPSPAYFDMIARKGELFTSHHDWTAKEVDAGRMTEEHRQRNLTRLWQEMLTAAELPPLPDFPPAPLHEQPDQVEQLIVDLEGLLGAAMAGGDISLVTSYAIALDALRRTRLLLSEDRAGAERQGNED
jgi:hypothetical protein